MDKIAGSKESYFPYFTSWATRKNFPFTEDIGLDLMWKYAYGIDYITVRKNEGILSSTPIKNLCESGSGLPDPEYEVWVSNRACYNHNKEKGITESEEEPLLMEHFKMVFGYFGVGMGLGTLALIIEILVHKMKNK